MTIAASRALKNDDVCFVGIGAPSAACNVARLTHAPDITLIYESGTIGTAPDVLPLSIGDGELSETALTTVAVPEMFRYWLQGGRVSIGFLGAAQLDKFGNINTTVIGDYAQAEDAAARRRRRAGDRDIVRRNLHHHEAIAARHGRENRLLHLVRPWRRRRPSQAAGHRHQGPDAADHRPCGLAAATRNQGIHGRPRCIRASAARTCRRIAAGRLRSPSTLETTAAPTELELKTLRDLQARTKAAHEGPAKSGKAA